MNDIVIERILTAYGYTGTMLLPVEKGYRNESHPFKLLDGQILNLILYKREPDILELIKNADRTANFAARVGLPARQTVGTKIIKLQTGNWEKYGKIYTYLPGHTVPWEAYTQEHIKLLGKTLSDLHFALRPLPADGYPRVAEQYIGIVDRMGTYFVQSGVRKAMQDKLGLKPGIGALNRFVRILLACRGLQHQQVLHMDFVRSNILFDDGEEVAISGILDFEKTAAGHPFFDIARTLAFLLVDCKYKTEEQTRKYFLQSGYVKRGKQQYRPIVVKNKGESYSLLEVLVELYLVHDFYKFLCHNPYESLPENEHFMRTRELLLDRQLVDTV
jgi:Ser/Thr protein kinase RdoA (MazF antagonist)